MGVVTIVTIGNPSTSTKDLLISVVWATWLTPGSSSIIGGGGGGKVCRKY